jgi:peptidoglycan/LPS O-acetylase OafA/YrhL
MSIVLEEAKSQYQDAAPSRDALPATELPGIAGSTNRIAALDFTKGALVLIMVLYHWLNYFVAAGHELYKYLRFLTPSFIFITGFLISNVSFAKYASGHSQIAKRLAKRGLKILGIFLLLNLLAGFQLLGGKGMFSGHSPAQLLDLFIRGSSPTSAKTAAFYILLPISYVLLLSAGVLRLRKPSKYVFPAVCSLCLVSIVLLRAAGLTSSNLELVNMGLLGIVAGFMPMETLNRLVSHPLMFATAYFAYIIAIRRWDVVYPLQIIGVALSLILIYWIGMASQEPRWMRRVVILLGNYSLFGYIAQIAILQLLHRSLVRTPAPLTLLGLSFTLAFVLTIATVWALDRAKGAFITVDRCYRVVFS